MTATGFIAPKPLRTSSLTSCLAALLGLAPPPSHGVPLTLEHASRAERRLSALELHAELSKNRFRSAYGSGPRRPEGVHYVTTCDDTFSSGSLRYEIANASDGDAIDLSQLEFVCSRITLGSEINVNHGT